MTAILVVGDLVTDVLVVPSGPLRRGSDTNAEIRLTGGGQAANTAAWLATVGADVTFACRVGDDPAGQGLLAELRDGGVRLAATVDPDAPTGTVVVLADPGGERTMLPDRGANDRLTEADVEAALDGAGHLHLSAYTLLGAGSRAAARHALATARGRGLRTSVDVASGALLADAGTERVLGWLAGTVDLVLANADEAAVLTGHTDPYAAALALAGADRAAVVKRGADGAVWAEHGEVVAVPAPAVAIVDTTGAGDAFAAGLLAALATGEGPVEALYAGVRLGSEVAARAGARP
ncbi:MAG TPA: PfkB family carbohydrate kinase [Mycobacteriales bacterium]